MAAAQCTRGEFLGKFPIKIIVVKGQRELPRYYMTSLRTVLDIRARDIPAQNLGRWAGEKNKNKNMNIIKNP